MQKLMSLFGLRTVMGKAHRFLHPPVNLMNMMNHQGVTKLMALFGPPDRLWEGPSIWSPDE